MHPPLLSKTRQFLLFAQQFPKQPLSAMVNKQMDRRTQRTRTALMSAFVELILSRGYGRVRIADIAGRANVGRSTFYLHYSNKEALLKESLKQPCSGLAACAGSDATPLIVTALLEHFRNQRRINRVFFEYPIRPVWVTILATSIEPYLARTAKAGMRMHIPRSLLALIVAEMQIALITHWLTDAISVKPDVIAKALVASTRAMLASDDLGC
jgi:AcrR family transcriptional regulator